uniref:Uncharacterized protein n=1 Tax=Cucumis melo TaxID=3656 RepID=A0A9I9CJY7_CUCME
MLTKEARRPTDEQQSLSSQQLATEDDSNNGQWLLTGVRGKDGRRAQWKTNVDGCQTEKGAAEMVAATVLWCEEEDG